MREYIREELADIKTEIYMVCKRTDEEYIKFVANTKGRLYQLDSIIKRFGKSHKNTSIDLENQIVKVRNSLKTAKMINELKSIGA